MFFQALILSAAIEAGFMSGGIYNYSAGNSEWVGIGTLYTKLEGEIQYQHIYINGEMDCYFTPEKWYNYTPFQMTYIFNAGLDYGKFKIGYEHSCFHPMQTYATVWGCEIKPKYEGSYDKIYVKFSIK